MAIPKNAPGASGNDRRQPVNNKGGLPRGPLPGRPENNLPANSRNNRPDFELPTIEISGEPSHTREYNFGKDTPKVGRIQADSGRVNNPYDTDDDTFTPLSIDEQLDYDSQEEDADIRHREDLIRKAKIAKAAREKKEREEQQNEVAQSYKDDKFEDEDFENYIGEEEVTPPTKKVAKSRKPESKSNRKKDKKGQDLFVDEEKLELAPFGGSNRKSRVNDFDGRKNLRQRSQIVQYIALALLLVVVLFSAKATFFPQKALDADQISTLIAETANLTEFPVESGKAFATDFMKAYLTVNDDAASKAVLGYYYTGVLAAADSPQRSATQGFQQKVVFGPTVYESKGLTPHSARYTIGALVESSAVGTPPPADGSAAKWEYFNVNVYYDKETNQFSITPDSPSVIPPVVVGDPTDIPGPAQIGTGDADQVVGDEIKSVVVGFIKGYQASSPTDSTALDQYIIANADTSLKNGLAGAFTLAGSDGDAIQYKAYVTEDPNQLKVAVTVSWRDQLGAADSVNTKLEYKSNYIVTLDLQTNGKYLVSKFAPQYFVADLEE